MTYTVLSPWGEVDRPAPVAISPRLDTLHGKTIGMFSHFKAHSPLMGEEIEKELKKSYPDTQFSYFQYPKDTHELEDDEEYRGAFAQWLSHVDGVIALYGDAGSCSMYHAMNTAYAEKLGKPCVMLVNENLISSAQAGCVSRGVGALRFVTCGLDMPSSVPALDREFIENVIRPGILPSVEKLADALTRPLTEAEATPPAEDGNRYAKMTVTGTPEEINKQFYRYGWGNGLPINLPTREAVDEMLRGTDLAPDEVIAVLPPMNGKATVEKIAVNAVMAGCLPTYMPILIAMVRCMASDKLHLVGWTCSTAGFAPIITLSGPIRKAISANCVGSAMSPLYKPNATIPRAYALINTNIAGVRPSMEITGGSGHENLQGIFLAEDEEASPWKPFHTEYGLEEGDSAVSMFWAHGRVVCRTGAKDAGSLLAAMCDSTDDTGFDPGVTFVINSAWANVLAGEGMTRRDVRDYITEYARKPATEMKVRWMKDNHHMPRHLPLPLDPTRSVRKYFDNEHIQVVICGSHDKMRCIAMCGGGDHGGPGVARIDLPKNWDSLVEQYADYVPEFIKY